MALIDTSELLVDPDFTDTATLIRRSSSVNTFGENELTETSSLITVVVQPGDKDMLERVPDAVRLMDTITVYYRGELLLESVDGYPDIIVWQGQRWQVKATTGFGNWGVGYTKTLCMLEPIENG